MDRLRGRSSVSLVLWLTTIAALVTAAAACGGATNGTLLAIDAKTGQELWRVRPPGGAVGRPLAVDGQVFVTTSNDCNSAGGTLVAYDASAGKEQWRAASGGCFSSAQARHGIVVAPGEKGQRLQGLDAHTGDSRWNAELTGGRDVTLIDGDNLVVVVEVAAYDAQFRALDRLTGQERWAKSMTLPGRFGPALASNTSALFLTQPFGGSLGAWPLTALDLTTGEQRWVANVGGAGTSLVGLDTNDDTAFVRFGSYTEEQAVRKEGSSTVAAFDARTGEEQWRHEERGDPFSADLAVADNSIYVYGLGEKLADTLTALNVQSGTVRWHMSQVGGTGQQTVAAGTGVVVLTISEESRGRVLGFAAADGSRLWETEVPRSPGVVHATTVSDGVVYVSAWGKVPSFGD
jgi:eukaryotic-like serine/threonine-protein kinase